MGISEHPEIRRLLSTQDHVSDGQHTLVLAGELYIVGSGELGGWSILRCAAWRVG